MYVAVAGNIGSGKSTLTRMLARHYRWEACFESVDNNPYLEDYYRDIHRWSFNLEVYFLKERFRDLIAIQQSGRDVIQDRTIFEVSMSLCRTIARWAISASVTTTLTWSCLNR